ncbi:hypothetical protein J2Y48_004719 [Mycoplana sp. BE70]|uniref:hypothetical protein n=1 Tax=Mycoplana sp. BE70 TaxID=2817775 RepID=UPI00285E9AB4|nr:hypothetical protein [Mycoplana sp. BE70]MDR6759403.1 hypothetical protein [Mycoplana sp. BE70]
MRPNIYLSSPSDAALMREMLHRAGYVTSKLEPINGSFRKRSSLVLSVFDALHPETTYVQRSAAEPYGHREECDGTWTVFASDTGKPVELGSRQVTGLREADAIELRGVFNRNKFGFRLH